MCDDSTSASECVCRYMSEKNINRAFPVCGTSVLDILMDKFELVTEATKKTFEANIEVLLQHGATTTQLVKMCIQMDLCIWFIERIRLRNARQRFCEQRKKGNRIFSQWK